MTIAPLFYNIDATSIDIMITFRHFNYAKYWFCAAGAIVTFLISGSLQRLR